jgi:hypothetical protein
MPTKTIGVETHKKINTIPGLIEKVAEHERELKEKHKIMFGNGDSIGWDEQLRNIFQWIESQKEAQEYRKMFWTRIAWIIATPILAGIGLFVYQAFVFFYEIVPILKALKP